MAKFTYEKLAPEYQELWDTMKIIRDAPQLHNFAEKVKQFKDAYLKVEEETGVPWQLVAVIHVREAGLSDVGEFRGVLHNGEKVVNTGRKTRIVPVNRGPFSTWHSAAVDALKLKGFDKIKSWPVSRQLWALEPYNGYGYRNKGLRSPYLWASTNHQEKGKYVADHVFDPNVMDKQMGCAAMLKFLGVGASAQTPASVPVVIGTSIAGAAVAVWYSDYLPLMIGALIIAGLGFTVYWWNKIKDKTNVKKSGKKN